MPGTYTINVTFTRYFQGFPFCNPQQASASKTITVMGSDNQQPPPSDPGTPIFACNSEFDNQVLGSSFTPYIPKSGPTFSFLATNPGYLRLSLPGNATFDHWTTVDEAPQLRRAVPAGDWELSTRMKVIQPTTADNYHVGLMVAFSQFDLFYFGIYQGNQVKVEWSGNYGESLPLVQNSTAPIELTVIKQGNTYRFIAQEEGSGVRNEVSVTKYGTPQFVGLIGKTWSSPFLLTVDFDYLHLSNC